MVLGIGIIISLCYNDIAIGIGVLYIIGKRIIPNGPAAVKIFSKSAANLYCTLNPRVMET